MENFRMFLLSAVILLLSQPLFIFAINFESAKESSCFEIKKTVPMDISWVMSTTKWYYPVMSRYDLYMTGLEISGRNAEDLREDEIYYDFCPTFTFENGKFIGEGFAGIKKPYEMMPVKGMEIFDFKPEGNPKGGKCHTTLTDNKSFAVIACCMDVDQMTWGAMSTVKKLPEETVKEIYDHVESLGFKREHFTGLRYGTCGKKKSKGKNEL